MPDKSAPKSTSKSVEKPTSKTADKSEKAEKLPHRNRNLLILGLGSIGIAVVTTSISLIAYHDSGNIYLDRSRPGFLPDESEVEAQQGQDRDFKFSATGDLTPEVLREYLLHYEQQLDDLDKLEKPFSSVPLSDESLGIVKTAPTDENPQKD